MPEISRIPLPSQSLHAVNSLKQNWPDMWVGLSIKRMHAEGKSSKTIENYTRAIRHFTSAFKKHPKVITQAEIKNYLFRFSKTKNLCPASHNLHVSGIKYFYNTVLGISDKNFALIKKRIPQQLFEVLSRSELARLFECTASLRDRLLLKAGYAFGLRVNRAVSLKLSDFDFRRNLLFIKADKGKKDRFVMMSHDFSEELGVYLKSARIKETIFPGKGPGGFITSMQANHILHKAAERAGITKDISFHTLRRSYATHLHEAGHSLRDIQVLMGHSSSRTTERYTKVSNKHLSQIPNPLDALPSNGKERRENQTKECASIQKLNEIKTNQNHQPAEGNIPPVLPYRQDSDYRGRSALPYS